MENGPGLKMYFLLKMGIFHGYVSLPEGNNLFNIEPRNKGFIWGGKNNFLDSGSRVFHFQKLFPFSVAMKSILIWQFCIFFQIYHGSLGGPFNK